MRKIIIPIILSLVFICLSAWTQIQPSEEKYTFNGESNVSVDNRHFVLENTPENIAEEVVIKDFLVTITADFDAKYDILADIESHKISIENEKKQFKDEMYTESYIIHNISTLTEKEYNDKQSLLYYYGWEEIVEKYKLTEYEIINIDYTQTLSNKTIEKGPQWGNGTFNRSFIVGKIHGDNSYRIFDFGMV